MRALGVDLGSRRIGVAVSDSDQTVASPVEVVSRSGSRPADHRRLLSIANEWEAGVIVVGVPLSLDGTVGPAASAVLDEIGELQVVSPMPVATVDERLSTVTAARHLRDAGLDERKAREVIDMHAAAVLLQAWLDGQSGPGESPSASVQEALHPGDGAGGADRGGDPLRPLAAETLSAETLPDETPPAENRPGDPGGDTRD